MSGARSVGDNDDAEFGLVAHRGDGMVLLAMNWKGGPPPRSFAGFGIQYVPPKWKGKPKNVQNRLAFDGARDLAHRGPSLEQPIQMFRWIHFPWEAAAPGRFRYIVTPRFDDGHPARPDGSVELRSGAPQSVTVDLARPTVPGLDVTYTRGFIASQAFVDQFGKQGKLTGLLPSRATAGLTFTPTHPKPDAAYEWMGFQARSTILDVLDEAIADPTAPVRVIAYDLNEPQIVDRLEQLGDRLEVIIDDSDDHTGDGAAEDQAADRLRASAGAGHVQRQHVSNLQHNKTIVVGGSVQKVLCGSTNFSWRGLFVQNNHVVCLTGTTPVDLFTRAFEQFRTGTPDAFRASDLPAWSSLALPKVDAHVTFSPHDDGDAVLQQIADDIRRTESSLFFSLAFLAQGGDTIRSALMEVAARPDVFVAGVSNTAVKGFEIIQPDGSTPIVHPTALTDHVPPPFSREPSLGGGINMHHKFVVIDFDQPDARVYCGSFNFSPTADTANGENLLRVDHGDVATTFAVEALRIFDHYAFRLRRQQEKDGVDAHGQPAKPLVLHRAPTAGGTAWFDPWYDVRNRQLDRELFSPLP